MRLAIVSTMFGAPWAGSEELWAATAEEALAAGHQVAVSVFRWPTIPPRVRRIESAGASVSFRPLLRHARVTAAVNVAIRPFRQLFAYDPDVVLVSQGNTYDLITYPNVRQLWRLLRARSVPFVILNQATDDRDVLSDAVRRGAAEYYAAAKRVAFVSAGNLASARRQLAVPIQNGVIVRNPVNMTSTDGVRWPAAAGPARIAMVARLEANHKGQDLALACLSAPTWLPRDWRLRLYGEGHDRQYLAELARARGIADRVEFCGFESDVRAIWADNELLLLPSRLEGTPLALVEAMLCGRAAVATDVGGNAEWVEDGRNGFLAEAATERSVGGALERAWSCRERWPEMGACARQRARALVDERPGRTLLALLLDAASSRA